MADLALRPIPDFSQPEYSVFWKAPDGKVRAVGRACYSIAVSSDPTARSCRGRSCVTGAALPCNLSAAKLALSS